MVSITTITIKIKLLCFFQDPHFSPTDELNLILQRIFFFFHLKKKEEPNHLFCVQRKISSQTFKCWSLRQTYLTSLGGGTAVGQKQNKKD